MRRAVILTSILLIIAGAAVAQDPAPAAPLVRQPGFVQCETYGFTALDAARNAMAYGESEQKLEADNAGYPETQALVHKLFQALQGGLKNHDQFAVAEFYGCADQQKLKLTQDLDKATVCFARTDVVFVLYADKLDGRSEAEALTDVQQRFAKAPAGMYPAPLLKELAPLTYKVSDLDGFHALRDYVFERCLFPAEWQAWWDSQPGAKTP